MVKGDPDAEESSDSVYEKLWSAVMGGFLPNVHFGVSVEDQKNADERIPFLLQTPAALRWLSVEPLLGPVDFSRHLEVSMRDLDGPDETNISWAVFGAESGANRRPMEVEWLTRGVDQFRGLDIPVIVKQGSALKPGQQGSIPDEYWKLKEFPTIVG
jgi:protein gp37